MDFYLEFNNFGKNKTALERLDHISDPAARGSTPPNPLRPAVDYRPVATTGGLAGRTARADDGLRFEDDVVNNEVSTPQLVIIAVGVKALTSLIILGSAEDPHVLLSIAYESLGPVLDSINLAAIEIAVPVYGLLIAQRPVDPAEVPLTNLMRRIAVTADCRVGHFVVTPLNEVRRRHGYTGATVGKTSKARIETENDSNDGDAGE